MRLALLAVCFLAGAAGLLAGARPDDPPPAPGKTPDKSTKAVDPKAVDPKAPPAPAPMPMAVPMAPMPQPVPGPKANANAALVERKIYLKSPQITAGSEAGKYNVVIHGTIELLKDDSTPAIKASVCEPTTSVATSWMETGTPAAGQVVPIRFEWRNVPVVYNAATKYEGDAELHVSTPNGDKWVRTNVEFTLRP